MDWNSVCRLFTGLFLCLHSAVLLLVVCKLIRLIKEFRRELLTLLLGTERLKAFTEVALGHFSVHKGNNDVFERKAD